jgi:hypothetical protein
MPRLSTVHIVLDDFNFPGLEHPEVSSLADLLQMFENVRILILIKDLGVARDLENFSLTSIINASS